MISSRAFWRTVISGIIATFVMTAAGFFQAGIGLPAIDVGNMLLDSFNGAHEGDPYTLIAGNLAHFANGVILALIWVAFLQKKIPGNWFIQGIIYAVITTVAAGLIVVPLATAAAGMGAGILFFNTPMPGIMILGSLVIHIFYGITLTLSLKVAGVEGLE